MWLYHSIHNGVASRPGLSRAVAASVRLLPGLVYAAYPAMLLYLLLFRRALLIRSVLVPAAGFLIATAVRAGINAPRPYEALGIPPVTPKETKGKSCPSRHAACAAVIAVTAVRVLPPLGAALCAIAILIAVSRVLAGVHFVRDVVFGLLLGCLIGWIGMYAVPW